MGDTLEFDRSDRFQAARMGDAVGDGLLTSTSPGPARADRRAATLTVEP
jgi:hypothetical protein